MLFALGVASGDPLPDSVILWTRLVAEPLADGGGMPTAAVPSFPAAFVDAIGAIASASPAVHYAEARHRGYVVVEVTPDELRTDYRYVSTTAEPTAELSTGASWRVRAGDPVPQPA